MKKALSLILALVLCLSLFACGNSRADKASSKSPKSPIVGTWHTSMLNSSFTYNFKENGKYTMEIEGSLDEKESGTYTFNKNDGTITFYHDDTESTYKIELRDCCMILNEVKYGKVYTNSESCDVLNVVLGKWVHTTLEGTSLNFNKDGTYSLTTSSGTATGVYIYDPVLERVELPNADLILEFEETSDGIRLNGTNRRGLYFKR